MPTLRPRSTHPSTDRADALIALLPSSQHSTSHAAELIRRAAIAQSARPDDDKSTSPCEFPSLSELVNYAASVRSSSHSASESPSHPVSPASPSNNESHEDEATSRSARLRQRVDALLGTEDEPFRDLAKDEDEKVLANIKSLYKIINDAGTSIMEAYNEEKTHYETEKAERLEQGLGVDEEEEAYMKEVVAQVDDTEVRLKSAMRHFIDSEQKMKIWPECRKAFQTHLERLETIRQNDRRRESAGVRMFCNQRTSKQRAWDSKSMYTRYGQNHNYVNFVRSVHDAKYSADGDNMPPLPNPVEWFVEEDAAAGHRYAIDYLATHNINAANEDSELQIASEHRSLHCPLTLLEFVDPVTSTVCLHSFEKSAIMDLLSQSRSRSKGQRAVKCPECDKMLIADMLQPDPVLKRRIERKHQAEMNAQRGLQLNEGHDHSENRASQNSDDADESMVIVSERHVNHHPVKQHQPVVNDIVAIKKEAIRSPDVHAVLQNISQEEEAESEAEDEQVIPDSDSDSPITNNDN